MTLEYPAVKAPSSVEELRALVGRDAKFLAKQRWVDLGKRERVADAVRGASGASYGYNNVRYMLETTLLWGAYRGEGLETGADAAEARSETT